MAACTKVNPAEEIYIHLENAVSLEAEFEAQQQPLSEAEYEEYQLYDEVLTLSDLEEISKLIKKAEELANSRKEMIAKERASIKEAYQEFLLIEPIIETIENEQLLDLAGQLLETMKNRYETYLQLYNEYKNAIALDIELYQLIQNEDLTIDQLEAQHDKVNESYSQVNHYKEKFNEYTVLYNDLKKQFYKVGELTVVYN